jgi:hypothetical protein
MHIVIGKRAWEASHCWIENGRFYWISPGGRKHSRRLSSRLHLEIKT